MSRRLSRGITAALLGAVLASAPISGAWAAGEGNIDHAETKNGQLRVLFSLPELAAGEEPDLGSLQVSVNGEPLAAQAELAASAGAAEKVRRTTIMTIDTSNSMRGDRFEQAKAAAKAFLDAAPEDLYVGIVAFAGSVEVVQQPTLDRQAAAAVLDELSLSLDTRLYDGVIAAAEAAGTEGSRSLLVLSDGRDTSGTELAQAVKAIGDADVRVDVVSLGQAAAANPPLEAMASEGGGAVIAAQDPEALTALFSEEAAALARQVLVTATLPKEFSGKEGSLSVSLDAGDETYVDKAFVSFGQANESPDTSHAPLAVTSDSFFASSNALWAGLAALGIGGLIVFLGAFGLLGKKDRTTLEQQISAYTRAGSEKARRSAHGSGNPGAGGVTKSAVGVAQKALEGNVAFESKLGGKLESANMALKPAEWLLIHAGIAVGAALFGFLVSSGGFFLTLVLFAVGALLPWTYLGVRKSRRQKAFNGQLAETLQLVAGSLSAGLSLSQSLDTVVREGSEPITEEFRRALVEARLGVPVEDALEHVAQRMESDDFEWVVMAIRIQREVGGNLAELLLKVAGTMRERDYLRRQVKTLSAEGKLSAYILGALPPGMFAYIMVANPDYVSPLYTTPLGWVMLAGAAMLMGVGSFWMSRIVKVDV